MLNLWNGLLKICRPSNHVLRLLYWEVVVAQLIEQLLSNPEVRGSDPTIIEYSITVNCMEKAKIKKKEAGNGPFKKYYYSIFDTAKHVRK